MDSKQIYKRVAVSFVASSFLAAGVWAAASASLSVGNNNWTMFTVPSDNSTLINNSNVAGLYSYSGGAWSANITTGTLSTGTGYLLKAGSSGLSETFTGTTEETASAFYTRVKALSANEWHLVGVRTTDTGVTRRSASTPAFDVQDILDNKSSIINSSACSSSTQRYVGTKVLITEGNQATQFTWKSSSDTTYGIPSGSAMFIYHGCTASLPTSSPITSKLSEDSNSITLSINNPSYSVSTGIVTDEGGVVVPNTATTETSASGDEVTTITTDTGGTSTTTVNVDTGAVTSEITTKDGTTTTVNSETEVEATVNSDGSITQSAVLSSESKAEKVEVTANTDGTTSASIKSKSGDTASVEIPAGADTVISSDGSITSNVKVDSSVSGKVDVKIKIDATTGKSSATVSQVVTINGKKVKQTFKVSDYDGTTESITEFIKASNLRAVDGNVGGIKKTFKSTRGFFASKKAESRATDYSESKTVEIISTTQWQKFEEIVLYNGKRSLTLLIGGADIVIDGERSVMEKNVEYLLPLEITEGGEVTTDTTDTTGEAIYTAGKLSLNTGWNLVSLPVDTTVDDLSIFGDYSTAWKYADKKWSQNPITLNKAEGIWFKMNSVNEVEFTGDAYEPMIVDLDTGWSLIGTGTDLTNFKSNNSLEALWTFQNNKWASNPETIYAGQGFWIKK